MSDRTERDDCIDEAFSFLVDDNLEGFAIAAQVDGELKAMSYTQLDEGKRLPTDAPACHVPRNELLGKLILDFSVMFRRSPEEVADIAEHVATDHLGAEEKTEQVWSEIAEEIEYDAQLPRQ